MPAVPILTTERLVLRGWRDEDREPFGAMNADPEVTRFLSKALMREESDALVDRIRNSWERRGWGLWAVERQSDGRFLGFTGLSWQTFEAPFNPSVEIGWRLERAAWGQGYATEAARAALAFAFERLELDEVMSFTTVRNAASRRVMEKIGLRHDPTADFEYPGLPSGHPNRPSVAYRITRNAWLAAADTGGSPASPAP